MIKRNKVVRLIVLLLTVALLLSSCTANALETAKKKKNTAAPQATAVVETPTAVPEPTATSGPLDEAQRIADYIFEHGELPENFIMKKQAQALGWDSMYNYVSDVAPGKSIGGDHFGNYEGKLPTKNGRKYYECDIDTKGKKSRGAKRIVFSNDGLIYYTDDHYESFTLLYGEE